MPPLLAACVDGFVMLPRVGLSGGSTEGETNQTAKKHEGQQSTAKPSKIARLKTILFDVVHLNHLKHLLFGGCSKSCFSHFTFDPPKEVPSGGLQTTAAIGKDALLRDVHAFGADVGIPKIMTSVDVFMLLQKYQKKTYQASGHQYKNIINNLKNNITNT